MKEKIPVSRLVNPVNKLHPDFWIDDKLEEEVTDRLIEIAGEFLEGLDIPVDAVKDITFTGSLANFNWTKLSDIDLHLILDFDYIDDNTDLVREFFSAKTSMWNRLHNIKILNFEVELYVQDEKEPHHSSGVYSVKNNDWLSKPNPISTADIKASPENLKRKAHSFIDMIERADDLFMDKEYSEAHEASKKLMDKIKKYRQAGLEKNGEQSLENLVFKYLRNNDYIKFLHDLRNLSYDRMMSLRSDYNNKLRIYVNKNQNDDEYQGFYKINELEKFQERVRKQHVRRKNMLIGLGNAGVGRNYSKAFAGRGKSAPAGFGGA